MNRDQVFDLMSFLFDVYPNFEVTQRKIDTWHKLLKDQNPAVVMMNAERYVLTNKFPPTISDLSERKLEAYESNILERIKRWENNAIRKQ